MKLTEYDNLFIIANVPYLSASKMARTLRAKVVSVQSRISLLQDKGIIPHYSRSDKRDNRISRVGCMNIKETLIHLHWSMEMPLHTMGLYTGETRASITASMKHNGVPWRTISEDNIRRFKDMPIEARRAQTIKANVALRAADYKPRPSASGPNNHQWKGGTSEYKGSGWYSARPLALNRDNYTCQACGATREDTELQVHHKMQWKLTHDNSVDNLITLCSKCHAEYETLWCDPEEV